VSSLFVFIVSLFFWTGVAILTLTFKFLDIWKVEVTGCYLTTVISVQLRWSSFDPYSTWWVVVEWEEFVHRLCGCTS
jgi:hypothetical protein